MSLVLHVGYPKCATTFLQKIIFPNIHNINYLGRWYGDDHMDAQMVKWIYDFVFLDSLSMSQFADEIGGQMNRDHVNLLSHEILLRPSNNYRLLTRLKMLEQHVGQIRIIVSIRNQVNLILSRYMHDRTIEGFPEYSVADALDYEGATQCAWPYCSNMAIMPFIKKKCTCRKAGVKYINVPFYNYLSLWCLLCSFFGKENIHLLVTEKLKQDPLAEFSTLGKFLGINDIEKDLNIALTDNEVNRQKNQDLYEQVKRTFLSSGKNQEVINYYSTSNKILDDVTQLDLAKYGYF